LVAVRAELLAAGLPPGSFRIEGVHEEALLPTDFWFLRSTVDGWEVGAYERGTYDVRGRFPDEEAAADAFYAALTGRQRR
jgi:hypothetical protein